VAQVICGILLKYSKGKFKIKKVELKTIVVHIPKRCRKPQIDVFDDHIDKVNNTRSKKYLPEDTNILAMGMGGQGLIDSYKEKHFGIKKTKSIVKPKRTKVNKSELKAAIKKQKSFVNGEKFW
tara:strand:- start:491 stop:859 length:369 start_codon:yes stop_codon:yes gene_type:complete